MITPNEVSLREWKGDEVTLLDSAEVESEKDVWYDLAIAWEEETLTVRRGLRGGEGVEILSAETTLESESTVMGFGLGAKADYLFDDVRFFAPSVEQSTMGRQYAYDAFGRRVAETFFVDGVSQTRYYVYDGDRVVEELDGDGNMTAGYVFGPYVDEVLAMKRDTDPESPGLETFYYLHDDQFNVIALTDAAGNVVERYEYGDFGDPTIYDALGVEREDKTSAFGNVYMFQGRPYDAETGLYYFRTRYLDPIQGRFISRDSIGVWGDANNLGNPYTFVGNNPWTNLDPYGLWAWDGDWIQYGVGGLLGFQGRDVFAEGVSEMHTDAAKGVKGMVWTGPKNAVVGVATVVIHPIETMEGARDFAYAAYNDFGGTAAAIGDSIAAAATNPESIGAFTFDIMAGVATGGAAKASSAGSVGKLTSMVKRIDWADNRGMVLNPFAKGALKRAPDGGGAAPKIVRIDSVKYPEAAKHLKEAGALDRPLTVDRAGAAATRKEALKGTATKPGLDRDEAPPAVFKEGSQSVRHIDSSDNRGAGGSIGQQLRNVKNGTQVILKTGRKK